MNKYLHEGLDLDRFAVVAIWPQTARRVVILMRSRYPADDPVPWCVQYRGSGYYFKSQGEAVNYCEKRGFRMEMRGWRYGDERVDG